ncbi:MAG: flagellar basal body-associated FliL family protein [Terriglobales bacterium]
MPDVPLNLVSGRVGKSGAERASGEPSSPNLPGAGPAKRAGGKKKWAGAIAGALILGGTIFLWPHAPGPGGGGAGSAPTETTLPLDTFVVNLDGAGQRAYLRVGITLGLAHPLRKEDAPIALVRDSILSVLGNAQPDQLLAAGGKQNLKAEIAKTLQENAPALGVENVYFTEFLVQM